MRVKFRFLAVIFLPINAIVKFTVLTKAHENRIDDRFENVEKTMRDEKSENCTHNYGSGRMMETGRVLILENYELMENFPQTRKNLT